MATVGAQAGADSIARRVNSDNIMVKKKRT